jgi:polar amino acid transport system substrate-binding protein
MKLAKLITSTVFGGLLTLGITSNVASADDLMAEIVKKGVLTIGVGSFVPTAMRNLKGEMVGNAVDVGNKVAKDIGVRVEYVPTAWDGIIPALLSGKFDTIISGMTITPKRNLQVNFTIPYLHSGLGMAASKKIASNMKTMAAYNNTNVSIACRRGSTGCSFAQELFPKAKFLQFDDDSQAAQEVINGNAHAWTTSEPKPTFWSLNYAESLYKPFSEKLIESNESFALRKGDPDALNFFNNWILVHQNNGWLEERHAYWFGTLDWLELVPPNKYSPPKK